MGKTWVVGSEQHRYEAEYISDDGTKGITGIKAFSIQHALEKLNRLHTGWEIVGINRRELINIFTKMEIEFRNGGKTMIYLYNKK